MSGPDLSRALTRVMGALVVADPLRVLFFNAYMQSDDTDKWPVPIRDAFEREYSKL